MQRGLKTLGSFPAGPGAVGGGGGTFNIGSQAKGGINYPLIQWSMLNAGDITQRSCIVEQDNSIITAEPSPAIKYRKFNADGSQAWESATYTAMPKEIVNDPTGNVFYTIEAAPGGVIKRYSRSTGAFETNIYSVPSGSIINRLKLINGKLWICTADGSLLRIPTTGGVELTLQPLTTATADFDIDSAGNIYLVYTATTGNAFFKYNSAGTLLVQKPHPTGGSFKSIMVDSAGDVYYSDNQQGSVQKVSAASGYNFASNVWTIANMGYSFLIKTDVDGEGLAFAGQPFNVAKYIRFRPNGTIVYNYPGLTYTGTGGVQRWEQGYVWFPAYYNGVIVYIVAVRDNTPGLSPCNIRRVIEKITF